MSSDATVIFGILISIIGAVLAIECFVKWLKDQGFFKW